MAKQKPTQQKPEPQNLQSLGTSSPAAPTDSKTTTYPDGTERTDN